MQAGKFNRYITVQQRADTEDTYGQPVGTWGTFSNEWAWVKTPAGYSAAREEVSGGAEVSGVAVSIRINRFREDVTAGMRVLDGSTVYNIRAVIPDYQRSQYTDLVCDTGANEG